MGSWIKVRVELVRSPKIVKFARALKTKKQTALGLAVQWFAWLDEQTEDGRSELTQEELDEELGYEGASAALVQIGWAIIEDDGTVSAVDFGKHNGSSAKRRAEVARNVAACKASKKRSIKIEDQRVGGNQKVIKNDYLGNQEGAKNDYLDKIREEFIERGDSKSNAICAHDAQPSPPPPGDFLEWVAPLAQAHPSLRKSRVLAPDVETAAKAAFSRCPGAHSTAPLLMAYFADSMQVDRHGKKFYRPTGQERFFADLEDVIAHAERWAKETGWGRKTRRRPASAATPPPHTEDIATEEDREAFRKQLHNLKGRTNEEH